MAPVWPKLLIALLASSAAAAPIPNGVDDAPEDHPNTVLLQVFSLGGAMRNCSGTVVGRDAVLTAAHCFDGVQRRQASIKVFTDETHAADAIDFLLDSKADAAEQTRLVKQANAFKAWDQLSPEERSRKLDVESKILELTRHDLAMVKIPPLSIAPAALATEAPASWSGLPVTLVGWGNGSADQAAYDPAKRRGSSRVRGERRGLLLTVGLAASRSYLENKTNAADQGADGRDVGLARGDSGGPMFDAQGRLVAVNAFTFPELELAIALMGDALPDAERSSARELARRWQTECGWSVSLADPDSLAFLAAAAAKGYAISGIAAPRAARSNARPSASAALRQLQGLSGDATR